MEQSDIVDWVKNNVEPISEEFDGDRYRCAATLNDGLYLPCVVIASSRCQVDLALRRFDETRDNSSLHKSVGYRSIVKTFAASGNRLNHYDIKDLSTSPYALPLARLREINGETSMGWTAFGVTMDDGNQFNFGTTFLIEFFTMPQGYTADRVVRITPAKRGDSRQFENVYRERPFFECYVDGL